MLDRDTNSLLRSCETAKTSDKGSVATMKCKYITKVKETFRNKVHRKPMRFQYMLLGVSKPSETTRFTGKNNNIGKSAYNTRCFAPPSQAAFP